MIIVLPVPVIPVKKIAFSELIALTSIYSYFTVSFVGTNNSKKVFSGENSNYGVMLSQE